MALYQGKYGKKSWGAGCSVALLSSSLMLTGCNSNNNQTVAPPPPEPTSRQVNLNFEALANGQTINCGTKLTGLGTAGSEAMLEDFRFYLYNLALIKDNGDSVAVTLDQNAWQAGNLALVDFQNKADKCSGADKNPHHDYGYGDRHRFQFRRCPFHSRRTGRPQSHQSGTGHDPTQYCQFAMELAKWLQIHALGCRPHGWH